MAFSFKSFNQLVTDQVNSVMGKVTELLDYSIGSILISWIESNSFLTMWLQGLIINVLTIIRAATIPDDDEEDLDTWFWDFSYKRFEGNQATGSLTFSRNTPDLLSYIDVGTMVQTTSGSVSFIVIADPTNPNFVPELNAYKVDIGVASISVPAQCVVVGTIGNVTANEINLIVSPIVGIDSVTNPVAFVNGQNKATNPQAKADFRLYLLSLAKANKGTIEFTILSNPNVKSKALFENKDLSGNRVPGLFIAIIDDGSGNPPSSLLQNVSSALDAVRGFTIKYAVLPPVLLTINVSAIITLKAGSSSSAIIQKVKDQLNFYITSLDIGAKVIYTKIFCVIYDTDDAITNVSNLLVNGGTTDITPAANVKVEPGTLNITAA
jgi:hypothetical protein